MGTTRFSYRAELLHFTNAEAVLSILSKRELWLTDFEQVNDQHEGTYGTTLFYELSKTKSVSDKVREILRGGIGMKEKWGIYACCLCAGGQTRKMWADYADCAKGGAIGFRYDLLFQAAVTSQAYALHPVLYNRDRQLDIATKTLDYAIHYKRNAEIGSWDEDSYWLEALLVVVGCASRFKDPIWSNEEEIRVAVWEPNPESRFEEDGKRRTKVAFDPATVTRVIRGKTAGPELSGREA